MPQRAAGQRREPPMSFPTPKMEPPPPISALSPPEEPPHSFEGLYGLPKRCGKSSIKKKIYTPCYFLESNSGFKVVAHLPLCQTISVCLHFRMKQNSSPEKVEIIGTGRTYMNLNFAGRFLPEIV